MPKTNVRDNQRSSYRRKELRCRTKVKCDDFELWLIQIETCFICQVSTKDNARSSTDGYKTLAKNMQEFHKKGKLGFHFGRISNINSDLL